MTISKAKGKESVLLAIFCFVYFVFMLFILNIILHNILKSIYNLQFMDIKINNVNSNKAHKSRGNTTKTSKALPLSIYVKVLRRVISVPAYEKKRGKPNCFPL